MTTRELSGASARDKLHVLMSTVTADLVIKFMIQAYDCSVARGEDKAQSEALLAYARGVKRKVDQSGAGDGGGGVAGSAAGGTQKPRHGGMSQGAMRSVTGTQSRWGGSAGMCSGKNVGGMQKGSDHGGSSASGGMELPECWNCRKKGHISAVCWAPGGGMDPARRMKKRKVDSPKGKAKAYVVEEEAEEFVEESDDEEEEDDNKDSDNVSSAWVMVIKEKHCENINLFDSGASRHISPFRDQFITY